MQTHSRIRSLETWTYCLITGCKGTKGKGFVEGFSQKKRAVTLYFVVEGSSRKWSKNECLNGKFAGEKEQQKSGLRPLFLFWFPPEVVTLVIPLYRHDFLFFNREDLVNFIDVLIGEFLNFIFVSF